MIHQGTKTIETVRLILRKFEETDAYDMFHNWASDTEVCRFLSWCPHKDMSITQERVKLWAIDFSPKTYNWAIYHKNMKEVIGSISIVDKNDPWLCCEVGYSLGRDFWGQGIMTEALQAVMYYMFYVVGYHRIQAKYDILNIASGRVMQKAGMRYEGTMRHAYIRKDGSFGDYILYAKLSTD